MTLGRAATLIALLTCTTAQARQSTLQELANEVVADICDRRLVLLGELPSQGESQAFQAKALIARGLVGHCGFDTVLFESGIYDFIGFEEAEEPTQRQLDRAIGRFCRTAELADFRQWLFEMATTGTLTLGGIDDQPSVTSDYARTVLPGLVGGPCGNRTVHPFRTIRATGVRDHPFAAFRGGDGGELAKLLRRRRGDRGGIRPDLRGLAIEDLGR